MPLSYYYVQFLIISLYISFESLNQVQNKPQLAMHPRPALTH